MTRSSPIVAPLSLEPVFSVPRAETTLETGPSPPTPRSGENRSLLTCRIARRVNGKGHNGKPGKTRERFTFVRLLSPAHLLSGRRVKWSQEGSQIQGYAHLSQNALRLDHSETVVNQVRLQPAVGFCGFPLPPLLGPHARRRNGKGDGSSYQTGSGGETPAFLTSS